MVLARHAPKLVNAVKTGLSIDCQYQQGKEDLSSTKIKFYYCCYYYYYNPETVYKEQYNPKSVYYKFLAQARERVYL